MPYLAALVAAGCVAAPRCTGRTATAGRPARRRPPRCAAPFWRFTAPRALANVAQIALQRVDIVLVAALPGSAAAAIYAVAGRFVVLGQLANQAISQVGAADGSPRLLGDPGHAATRTLYQRDRPG